VAKSNRSLMLLIVLAYEGWELVLSSEVVKLNNLFNTSA